MDYNQVYNDLGVKLKRLPDGYNPDEFAKELMKNFPKEDGVLYSSSTNEVGVNDAFSE